MCGRYLLKILGIDLAETIQVPVPEQYPLFERYNIAPGQTVPVVTQEGSARVLRFMRWGLIPSWAKDPKIGYRAINAKCETIAEKPAFRAAFKRRHCLVPASGFYEWRKEGKKKLPMLMRPRMGIFAFAGLWETWPGGTEPLDTFTIITTTANELVRPIHDRMPVALRREDFAAWLDPAAADGQALLKPYPAEDMTAVEVDPWVNNARNEGPKCIEPVESSPSLFA